MISGLVFESPGAATIGDRPRGLYMNTMQSPQTPELLIFIYGFTNLLVHQVQAQVNMVTINGSYETTSSILVECMNTGAHTTKY